MKRVNGQQTNQLQARHLSDRVSDKYRELQREIYKLGSDRKEPPTIKQARRMVKAWDQRETNLKNEVQRRADTELRNAAKVLRERILFAAPKDALTAVQQFELRVIK